jgi:hypothetical protein
VSDGFLHFLQRLFGLGGDRPKQAQPAPPSKKNRPSHAPKRKDKGAAKKEPPGDNSAKEPPSRDKPAKKVAAKPKPGTRPKSPPSAAAPTEASGKVPAHERPHGDRQKESPKEMAAPSVCAPATPEKPERKPEPGAKPAPPPAVPAFDPKFGVLVSGNEIVITLMGTSYSVTYFKRKNSPGLFAKDITLKDDPHIPMTSAEFLTGAWKLANDKARELDWIV